MIDRATRYIPLPALARMTGRCWWAMRYRDGRVLEEPHCDWSRAPLGGRQSVRLYCPNGQIAELGNEDGAGGDATGRLFQLKQAIVSTARGRRTLCHMVGIVQDPEGNCLCAVWEYLGKKNGRLLHFKDNVYNMKYGNIGRLAFENVGLSLP